MGANGKTGGGKGKFVIIGGGPTTTAVRDYAGADAWSLDPKVGVDTCKEFVLKQGS